jgi:protein DGCR14
MFRLEALGVRATTEQLDQIMKTPATSVPSSTPVSSGSVPAEELAPPVPSSSFDDPETPQIHGSKNQTARKSNGNPAASSVVSKPSSLSSSSKPNKLDPTSLSLGAYLATHTSEDNASFSELLDKDKEKFQQKFWWIEDQVKLAETHKLLMNKPFDQRQGLLETWAFKSHNALMFYPKTQMDKDTTAIEKFGPKRTIAENTRFKGFSGRLKPSADHSSKDSESDGSSSPKVGGFGFVPMTPTIDPNAGSESPFVTWGNVVGTPLHLTSEDGKDIPKGPIFKIPALPKRDHLGRKLSKQAADR